MWMWEMSCGSLRGPRVSGSKGRLKTRGECLSCMAVCYSSGCIQVLFCVNGQYAGGRSSN